MWAVEKITTTYIGHSIKRLNDDRTAWEEIEYVGQDLMPLAPRKVVADIQGKAIVLSETGNIYL